MKKKINITSISNYLLLVSAILVLIVLFGHKTEANNSGISETGSFIDKGIVGYNIKVSGINTHNEQDVASMKFYEQGILNENFILKYFSDRRIGIKIKNSETNALTLKTPFVIANGFSGTIVITWKQGVIKLYVNDAVVNSIRTDFVPDNIPGNYIIDNNSESIVDQLPDAGLIAKTNNEAQLLNPNPFVDNTDFVNGGTALKTNENELVNDEALKVRVSNGYLTIGVEGVEKANVFVVGLSGEMIYNAELNGRQIQLPNQLMSGVYIVIIKYRDQFLTRKIYIQS